MATTLFNTTRTASTAFLIESFDRVLLGRDAFWDNTGSTNAALEFEGSGLLFVAGQIYSEGATIRSSSGFNGIDIAASGILVSVTSAVFALANVGNYVANAGYISGLGGIAFGVSGNSVVNSGVINATGTAVQFGFGFGDNGITNSGTLISNGADGIQYDGTGTTTILNTGLISAELSSAIVGLASGANIPVGSSRMVLTNTGTIRGLDALRSGGGADRIINSGTMSGLVALGGGDDFFDTSLGITDSVVLGESGNDTIIGSALEDRVNGDLGDDSLSGNGGNDLLEGGAGADALDGGAGSDTASYAGSSGLTVDLADGSRNTGDALGDTFVSIENVLGSGFADTLLGDAERNVLRGGAGSDVLDGRGGADRLVGGTNNDIYVVDDRGDRVVELANEGADSITSTISLTLPDFVEDLFLTGTAALSGTGNASSNQIFGNAGANIIDGLFGNDYLIGDGGADQFRFTTALDGLNNVDLIGDFTPGADKIALSRAIFTPLGGGSAGLQAAAFVTGTAAGDANDRIIYDSATGRLFYDPDGTGAVAQTLFARIDAGVVLTATDFIVFG